MLQGWQGTGLPAFPISDVPPYRFNCGGVSFSDLPLSNISTPCLLIKLLCCGPEVAAAFREERIGSVLEPLMTFLTSLTVVSIETTSVAPEGDQEMVG